MLDHAVRIQTDAGPSVGLLFQASPDMHAGRIEPYEERLLVVHSLVDELVGSAVDFLVYRWHARLGQRSSILDPLFADLPPPRLVSRIILIRGPTVQHTARSEIRLERRILRIVVSFRLLFCIQVVEVAKELIKSMHRRQVFI